MEFCLVIEDGWITIYCDGRLIVDAPNDRAWDLTDLAEVSWMD